MSNSTSMSGSRSLPADFPEVYAQYCENFTHKLQCQVYRLLSTDPSLDFKDLHERLDELVEKIMQIGYLAEVGEFAARDSPTVLRQWGVRSVKEICGFIRLDLIDIRDGLEWAVKIFVADRLVGILDTLPF